MIGSALQPKLSALVQRAVSFSPTAQATFVALLVGLTSAILRLIGLGGITPGFRHEEATSALMAQRVSGDNLPIFFGHDMDGIPPFFPYAVKVTGTLAGWDVEGPRVAAAVCGIAVAIFSALWLVRAIGPLWGSVGGTLAATSFWQLMFSRQAVPSISSALFVALGLWLSWLALERGSKRQPERFYRRTDLPLYIAAGAVFGFGFHSHVSYVVVPPLVLLTAGVITLNQQRARRASDALGPGLLLLAMVVAMTPLASHYLDQPDDFRRALDIAAGLPDDLANTGDDVADGLRGLFWRGSEDAAVNLPGRSILGPILSFWTVAGLLAALRRPAEALEATVLIWSAIGVFAIALVGGDDPALYFPLAPIFVALPVIGMHAAWGLAQQRQQALRTGVGLLIAASVLVSAGWSIYDYFWQWSDAPATYPAMRGDVREAMEAFSGFPDDDIPAYVAAGDAERIVRYLAPDRLYHPVVSSDQISIAADDDAYLIAPRSTEPVPQLRGYLADAELLETGKGPNDEISYRIWLVGPRTREALPYAIPTIPFENGWSLPGFDARAAVTRAGEQPEIEIVLLWQVPFDADSFEAEVRLRPPGDSGLLVMTEASVLVVPWKEPGVQGGELLLVHTRLPFPRTGDLIASLQVGLRDPATGELVTPLLNEQDEGYAFLNDIQIVLP